MSNNQNNKKGKISDLSLFDNPLIQNAIDALSETDKERYKELGEEMFNSIDFETSSVLNNYPPPVIESLKDIEQQLKDGLHPTDMEEAEKRILVEI